MTSNSEPKPTVKIIVVPSVVRGWLYDVKTKIIQQNKL